MFSRIYSHTVMKNKMHMVKYAMRQSGSSVKRKKTVTEAAEILEGKISQIQQTVRIGINKSNFC